MPEPVTAEPVTAEPVTAEHPAPASVAPATRRTTARKASADLAVRSKVPTLREERRLLREGHLLVAGMDEVGRGALAGPVSVGVVVIDASVRTAPAGVRDSKLLTPAAREALVPRLRRWAVAHAVGHAEPEEIDRYGIIAALRLAGRRALATLPQLPGCVLLDGSHDWLSPPRSPATAAVTVEALFELDVVPVMVPREIPPPVDLDGDPRVLTMIKADLRCAAVAAASVLAKVERDAIMVKRAITYPQYKWHNNKGYSAPEHLVALTSLGPCEQHRRSWSLPGVGCAEASDDMAADDMAADDMAADDMAADDMAADDEFVLEEVEQGADLVVDLMGLDPAEREQLEQTRR
jgi:ribonuclease HII